MRVKTKISQVHPIVWGHMGNKYKYVFASGTLWILPDTYLVPVSHVMGQELGISMPYEYMWGLSREQRGTTELTIYTAFISH